MELKHGYYHLIAILVVAIWGLTFISTKVLINHGPVSYTHLTLPTIA